MHKTDHRGIVAILVDHATLCEDVGVTKVPHLTTLQKAGLPLLRDAKIEAMRTGTLRPLLEAFRDCVVLDILVADAGYGSQGNHELLRDEPGIEAISPLRVGRPTARLPTGRRRCEMAMELNDKTYRQRWRVETVMFMLKRHQGESPTTRNYQTRRREMGLMAITQNVRIVYV